MVAIVKIKVIYSGNMKSKTYAENATIVWIYNTLDESLHNGSQIWGISFRSRGPLERCGYKKMRSGRETDQYTIDLSFKGEKDIIYSAMEKQIRPLVRDRLLTEILN